MATKGKAAKKSKPAGRGDISRRLKDISAISTDVQKSLQDLDIVRADQLTAAASIAPVRGALARHLGITDQQLENAVVAASATLKEESAVPQQPVRNFPLGALRPPPQAQAAALSIPLSSTHLARASLPSSANLVPKMSPIRNQGGRGTCVAFCLTAIHEFETRAKNDNFSERFLYYKAKAIDGSPAECGTTQDAASKVLATSGQCMEKTWPYNPNDSCNDHGALPKSANADGAKHKISLTGLNPHDIVSIKTAVAGRRPVGVSIPVYVSWYQSPTTERTGRITMPIGGERDVGGHCVCIVGYQDDGANTVTETPGGGFFILRNSWSTVWGHDCSFGAGYGTIPYAYIAAYNWEAYGLPVKKDNPKKKTSTKKARAKRASTKKK
jgi:hypothetical protein